MLQDKPLEYKVKNVISRSFRFYDTTKGNHLYLISFPLLFSFYRETYCNSDDLFRGKPPPEHVGLILDTLLLITPRMTSRVRPLQICNQIYTYIEK